jgi:hypothetical protein
VVLDGDRSSITLPNLGSFTFPIPGVDVNVKVLFVQETITYRVSNLVSKSVTLGYEQGGLALTIDFNDQDHAIRTGTVVVPDFNVKNLRIKVILPLSYEATLQFFRLGTPTADVAGDWSANGPFGFAFNPFVKGINDAIKGGVVGAIQAKLPNLSYEFTRAIDGFIPGGRITGADIETDQMKLSVELARLSR